MSVYELGNDRMLCWDDFIIDKQENIDIQMHHPVPAGDKVTFDNEWDGCCNGYCTFIQAGDMYYLYYRAMHYTYNADGAIFRGYQKKTPYCIKVSRDGYNFKRFNEAFHTPGIENRNNWWYGDAVKCGGLIVTESDLEGAPDEYSIFFIQNYHIKNPYLVRHTMRFDGFFSWYAKYDGGTALTKPFTFKGNELEVNFSTSAFSGIDVVICDENGNELEGYKKYNIFGDSINRKVIFEKDLKELEGKPVRIKFTLQDAHLYSFKFN